MIGPRMQTTFNGPVSIDIWRRAFDVGFAVKWHGIRGLQIGGMLPSVSKLNFRWRTVDADRPGTDEERRQQTRFEFS